MYPTYLQSLWVSREEIIELSDLRDIDILDNFASRTVARERRTQDDGSKRVARKWESRGVQGANQSRAAADMVSTFQ